jgi:peroxin-1
LEDVDLVCANFIPSSASRWSENSADETSVTQTQWSHVGGYSQVRESILEVLRYPLIYKKLFRDSPIKLPRAILLYGPPGCGKTFIAQAAGAEFGLGFISIRGPQLLDKYIGASEKAVRDLFAQAVGSGRPSLIFFDEFESLAAKRGKDNTGVTDRIVNQLLTFIDGVELTMSSSNIRSSHRAEHDDENEEEDDSCDEEDDSSDTCTNDSSDAEGEGRVFIIAATSRPDLVDTALLRPGRIEKHLYVGIPTGEEKFQILQRNLITCRVVVDDELEVQKTLKAISNEAKAAQMTSADLKAIINTAFLLATHEAISTHVAGPVQANRQVSIVNSSHLWSAFHETKPSVTEKDMAFYDSIYRQFRGDKKRETKSDESGASLQLKKNQIISLR